MAAQAAAVCALLLSVGVEAAPRLSLGTVRGFPGATVEVPLQFSRGSNPPAQVVALQADVVVESGLAASTAPSGGTALRGHVLASSQPESNRRRLLVYSPNNQPLTNGVVANIPFTVPDGSFQNVRLSLTNAILAQADATAVSVITRPGGIAINPVYLRPDGGTDGFLTVATNAEPDQCYLVQATTDFARWVHIFTNTASGSFLLFDDAQAGQYRYRFYRAVRCEAAGQLDRIEIVPGGGVVSLDIRGLEGRTYTIEASTTLADWTALGSATAVGGRIAFPDPNAGNFRQRFYRLRSGP